VQDWGTVIDLRSDTVTTPSAGMRAAMAAAEVGDDIYGEDPTVNELERRTAELLGHEAGLFVPTGTMANLLGIFVDVPRGQEVLCDEQAHLARAESGSHAALHGIMMRTWSSGGTGLADPAVIAALISPPTGFLVTTGAVEVEQTHNFGGGSIQPFETLRAISRLCADAGVTCHLDGARLWNAHVATGVGLAEYGALFDTVNVCYSKGLGAPVGSVLVGRADAIAAARNQRKALGAGWRQAGVLAGAALWALDHNIPRLAEDHAAAAEVARLVSEAAPAAVPRAPQTNIVVFDTGTRPAAQIIAAAAEAGVRVSGVGPHAVRAVTHLDVTYEECVRAGQALARVFTAC